MKQRIGYDVVLFLTVALLASISDISRIEARRAVILAAVYLFVGALALFRRLPSPARRLLDVSTAVMALAIAWFLSFAAWSHSGEIGIYLLFAFAVLVARDVSQGEGGTLATV